MDIMILITNRIKMLYEVKKDETDRDELLKLEGKISELVALKATLEIDM